MTEAQIFDETLRTDLSGLKNGITDLGIDFLSNNNLPIFCYFSTVHKTINIILKEFEIRKLYEYLVFVKETSLEERVKFLEKINANQNLCSSFSEMTITVLQKVDDIVKAKIIGYITRQMILENIERDIGIRTIRIIEKIIYQDLVFLMKNDISEWHKNQIIVDSISSLGILTSWQIMVPSENGFPMNYKINKFGELFKNILNDYILLGETSNN